MALLLNPPTQDADVDDADQHSPDAELWKLHDFCASHTSGRRRASSALVCAEQLEGAHIACLRGDCPRCGFNALWEPVHRKLVYDSPAGKLRQGVCKVWLTTMNWDRIKVGGDGSNSEAELRQQRKGTLIQFLDEAGQAYSNFKPHSFHIQQSRMADHEYKENVGPGMIQDNSDWSENGECKVKHQMQSEYWHIMYYSLLISICSFLITSIWIDRSSALKKGVEVTVEPNDSSVAGSVTVVEGSYFAIIDVGSTTVGSDVIYTVKKADGERHEVLRQYLRERRWHRVAFLQVTNDKKHDCWSSQAFADKRIKFFDIYRSHGLDDALNFARKDGAEEARITTKCQQMAANASETLAGDTALSQASDPHENAMVIAADTIVAEHAASKTPVFTKKHSDISQHEVAEWHKKLQRENFWAWVQQSDNATHFKSKENLNFWSEVTSKYPALIKQLWVEFGCPGHGKGPWDGLGAMVKTKVSRDITDCKERTPSHCITSALEVAQHLRSTFSTDEWRAQHMDMKINQVVVMYLDIHRAVNILRPESPPDVSPCKAAS